MSGLKLNIPIQINGDTSSTTPPSKLLDRELYIMPDGVIYFGNSTNTPNQIRTNYLGSDGNELKISSFTAGSNTSEIQFNFNDKGVKSYIGKNVYKFGDALNEEAYKNELIPTGCYGGNYGAKLYGFHLNESIVTRSKIYRTLIGDSELTRITKIALNEGNCYGTELPENGSEGQIFFLLD